MRAHMLVCGTAAFRAATVGSFLAIVLGGCTKDGIFSTTKMRAQLDVSAQVAGNGEQLDVRASYLRRSGAEVELAKKSLALSGPGAQTVQLDLDITDCLVDPEREVQGNTCPVTVDAVLRDAAGVALDSSRVGPLDVGSGATVSPPAAITLQAAASLVVDSGDQQLAWAGGTVQLPLVLRLKDRAGAPIAGRAVSVEVQGGGGTVLGGPFVTNAQGLVTVGYRMGAAPGVNTLRAKVALGSAFLAVPLTFTGVEIRRERIAAGNSASCAIFPSGSTRCWGNNDAGLLGTRVVSTPGDTLFPVDVAGGNSFVALAASKTPTALSEQVCGLTTAGAVLCWGLSSTGELGMTGGDTCQPSGPVNCAREPQRISPNGLVFATIDVGGGGLPDPLATPQRARACGVTVSGDAYCWGENSTGAIGDGTTTHRSTPTKINSPEKWIDVTTGTRHSCGVTVRGEAWCWGDNSFAGMGTGDTLSSLVPKRVKSTEFFRFIDAGYINTCGITLGNVARCWGLGGSDGIVDRTEPGTASNDPVALRLSVGSKHACGASPTGIGVCAGLNVDGVLGDGTPPSTPPIGSGDPVNIRTSTRFSEVSAGLTHSCGLSDQGEPFCWGRGTRGEVGGGTRGIFIVPVKVATAPTTAGAPAHLLATNVWQATGVRGFACPAPASGTNPPLGVQVLDANGYRIAGSPIEFFARTAGAQVSAPSTFTTAAGIAATGCTLSPTPGLNVFVVRSPDIPGDSVVYQITGVNPGAAAHVNCAQCTGLTGVVGTTLSFSSGQGPSVIVTDARGFPVANALVSFTSSRPGSNYSPGLPATVPTNFQGVASIASWALDTVPRTDTVVAVVQGLPGNPQYLTVTSVPDAPVIWKFTQEPPDTVKVSTTLPVVEVTLYDRFGNIATNAPPFSVDLALLNDGAAQPIVGTTLVNTVNGVARFTGLRIDQGGMDYQFTVFNRAFQRIFGKYFTVEP